MFTIHKVCIHIDPKASCADCIQSMYNREKGKIEAQLELLELKNKFLQKVARGELGEAEPLQTFESNGRDAPDISTPIEKLYAWRIGECYAIDTYGRLYRQAGFYSWWMTHDPQRIDAMQAVIRQIQYSLG